MNRIARVFRVFSGILMLGNIAVFFLPYTPVIVCIQENYPQLRWSQMNYMTSMISGKLPYEAPLTSQLGAGQIGWIIGMSMLPALLSVILCIWCMLAEERQVAVSVMVFVETALYVGTAATVMMVLKPESVASDIQFSRGIAVWIHLILCGAASILSLLALVGAKERVEETLSGIPQVETIKQEQIQAKYSVILETSKKEEPMSGIRHGMMVGICGMYAGAQIPLAGGEYIKLGRLADNDLVFDGEKKISRNHCKIRWSEENQQYVLMDFSSNGTFVKGQPDCLPHNLELNLPPGTVISIGDETNQFQLE